MESTNKKKVLLLEDDTLLCELLRDTLAQHSFEVTTANCGQEALRAYAWGHHHILVLDLNLPDIPGLAVLAMIRELKEEPPPLVIVFSGFVTDHLRKQGSVLGIEDYLQKPFEVDHLASRVRSLASRIGHLADPPAT